MEKNMVWFGDRYTLELILTSKNKIFGLTVRWPKKHLVCVRRVCHRRWCICVSADLVAKWRIFAGAYVSDSIVLRCLHHIYKRCYGSQTFSRPLHTQYTDVGNVCFLFFFFFSFSLLWTTWINIERCSWIKNVRRWVLCLFMTMLKRG